MNNTVKRLAEIKEELADLMDMVFKYESREDIDNAIDLIGKAIEREDSGYAEALEKEQAMEEIDKAVAEEQKRWIAEDNRMMASDVIEFVHANYGWDLTTDEAAVVLDNAEQYM